MRILLVNHAPLAASESGKLSERLALALNGAGHQARVLVLDDRSVAGDVVEVRRIVCDPTARSADLAFGVAYFSREPRPPLATTFAALADEQIVAYRDAVRRHLDDEVNRFDPHVIHVQHVWLQGQLALETGVPYVTNAWPDELVDYALDARYRHWALQAVENSSRILVPDDELRDQVAATFEDSAERIAVGSLPDAHDLVSLYETVRRERFGTI